MSLLEGYDIKQYREAMAEVQKHYEAQRDFYRSLREEKPARKEAKEFKDFLGVGPDAKPIAEPIVIHDLKPILSAEEKADCRAHFARIQPEARAAIANRNREELCRLIGSEETLAQRRAIQKKLNANLWLQLRTRCQREVLRVRGTTLLAFGAKRNYTDPRLEADLSQALKVALRQALMDAKAEHTVAEAVSRWGLEGVILRETCAYLISLYEKALQDLATYFPNYISIEIDNIKNKAERSEKQLEDQQKQALAFKPLNEAKTEEVKIEETPALRSSRFAEVALSDAMFCEEGEYYQKESLFDDAVEYYHHAVRETEKKALLSIIQLLVERGDKPSATFAQKQLPLSWEVLSQLLGCMETWSDYTEVMREALYDYTHAQTQGRWHYWHTDPEIKESRRADVQAFVLILCEANGEEAGHRLLDDTIDRRRAAARYVFRSDLYRRIEAVRQARARGEIVTSSYTAEAARRQARPSFFSWGEEPPVEGAAEVKAQHETQGCVIS